MLFDPQWDPFSSLFGLIGASGRSLGSLRAPRMGLLAAAVASWGRLGRPLGGSGRLGWALFLYPRGDPRGDPGGYPGVPGMKIYI